MPIACKLTVDTRGDDQVARVVLEGVEMQEGMTFAFYLNRDGARDQTRWYTEQPEAEFALLESGNYQAIAFIKATKDGTPQLLQSDVMAVRVQYAQHEWKEIPPTAVSIFGSCVSRDTMSFDPQHRLSLQKYIARESIVSAVALPISIEMDSIQLSSRFQREQIYTDFRKTALEQLAQSDADYLLVDFVDERFALLRWGDSLVTLSNELVNSGLPLEGKERLLHVPYEWDGVSGYTLGDTDMDRYVEEFCRRVLEIFPQERIILHHVQAAECYLDLGKVCRNFPDPQRNTFRNYNRLWQYMCRKIQQWIPRCHVIDVSAGYMADEAHQWGLSPIHFQKEYYQEVMFRIYEIISSQAEQDR